MSTPHPPSEILLLTLGLDPDSFAHFDALRRAHFPAHRNKIPAHLTLFHALPAADRAAIEAVLAQEAQAQPTFPMVTKGVLFLGFGVALTLYSPVLQSLHARLKSRWHDWLKPQDRDRPFTPHITIQNKASPECAKTLYAEMQQNLTPCPMTATGFDLWFYRHGPWEHARHFAFKASDDAAFPADSR